MYNYYMPMMDRGMYQKESLYDPYNGLLKGNMFPNEYLPYKDYKNYPIKANNEYEQLLNEIYAYGFAMTDLDLYLDLYPNDEEKISLYNQYKDNYKLVVNAFENKYGPLNLESDSLNNTPWTWIRSPWPWERRS